MASNKSKEIVVEAVPEVVIEAPEVVEEPKAPVIKESAYTADYLIANFKAFQTSKEIVAVALRLAGKKTATFSEAKKIIETFKNKEVK